MPQNFNPKYFRFEKSFVVGAHQIEQYVHYAERATTAEILDNFPNSGQCQKLLTIEIELTDDVSCNKKVQTFFNECETAGVLGYNLDTYIIVKQGNYFFLVCASPPFNRYFVVSEISFIGNDRWNPDNSSHFLFEV